MAENAYCFGLRLRVMRRSRLIKENNMFCQKCGAQLPENAKFCANCGAANEFAAQNNTVPQPVQNVEPIQPAQPIQPTQSAQPQNPTELLMNEYYKAAEPQIFIPNSSGHKFE